MPAGELNARWRRNWRRVRVVVGSLKFAYKLVEVTMHPLCDLPVSTASSNVPTSSRDWAVALADARKPAVLSTCPAEEGSGSDRSERELLYRFYEGWTFITSHRMSIMPTTSSTSGRSLALSFQQLNQRKQKIRNRMLPTSYRSISSMIGCGMLDTLGGRLPSETCHRIVYICESHSANGCLRRRSCREDVRAHWSTSE